MGQKFVITEEDRNRIRGLYEQTEPILLFEKVVDVPNTNKADLFNLIKGNRDIFKGVKFINEIPQQQLNLEKTYMINMRDYKLIGKNLVAPCNEGPLTWDLTIIVKDNKFKLISDNFRWTNSFPGSPCKLNINFNPMTTTRPKGLTVGPFWDDIIELIPIFVNNFYNQINIVNTQSDF